MATVLLLGMLLVGIEVITAANRQIPGPMGWAIAISVAVCRTGVDRRPARRDSGFGYEASQFGCVAVHFFGGTVINWLCAAVLRAGIVGLLAIM